MPEIRNYLVDIEVDRDNLESEWMEHPSIYVYYSDAYAKAEERRDDLKLDLEVVDAKLDLAIRKNYEMFGFEEKPTETAIKKKITISEKHVKASKALNKANRIVNSMKGIKTGFEHKKHALGNLVALKIGGFYSEPRNMVKDVKKLAGSHKQQKENLNDRMKKRKEVKAVKTKKI